MLELARMRSSTPHPLCIAVPSARLTSAQRHPETEQSAQPLTSEASAGTLTAFILPFRPAFCSPARRLPRHVLILLYGWSSENKFRLRSPFRRGKSALKMAPYIPGGSAGRSPFGEVEIRFPAIISSRDIMKCEFAHLAAPPAASPNSYVPAGL
jgi:hypothetical protein